MVPVGPMMRTMELTPPKHGSLSMEVNSKPADAGFFPLDSACEEHTCPWNFAEGGRDFGSLECAVEKLKRSLNSCTKADGVV